MSYMRTWLSSNGAQQKCDRSKRQRRAGALGRTWGGSVHLVDCVATRVNTCISGICMPISGTFKVESYSTTILRTVLVATCIDSYAVCTACAIGPAKTPPLPLPIASPIPPNMLRPSPVLRGPFLDMEPDLL